MRRKDREVTDFSEIAGVIDECYVLRLGLCDGTFPYIVPVNFAYQIHTIDEIDTMKDKTIPYDLTMGDKKIKIEFFIHGAKSGRKADLIKKNSLCSFEMDCAHRLEIIPATRDITMRYKCIMGKAKITTLEGDEKLFALEKMVNRYEETKNFDWNRHALPQTLVCRLDVLELTCKINRSTSNAN